MLKPFAPGPGRRAACRRRPNPVLRAIAIQNRCADRAFTGAGRLRPTTAVALRRRCVRRATPTLCTAEPTVPPAATNLQRRRVDGVKHFRSFTRVPAALRTCSKYTIAQLNVPLTPRSNNFSSRLSCYLWIRTKTFRQPPIIVNLPEFRCAYAQAARAVFGHAIVVGQAFDTRRL